MSKDKESTENISKFEVDLIKLKEEIESIVGKKEMRRINTIVSKSIELEEKEEYKITSEIK